MVLYKWGRIWKIIARYSRYNFFYEFLLNTSSRSYKYTYSFRCAYAETPTMSEYMSASLERDGLMLLTPITNVVSYFIKVQKNFWKKLERTELFCLITWYQRQPWVASPCWHAIPFLSLPAKAEKTLGIGTLKGRGILKDPRLIG